MRSYDTIIFDLDGTLLDTLEDLTGAVNFVMEKNGYPKRTLEEVRRFVGNGIRRLMEQAVPDFVSGELFERNFVEFREFYTENCQLKTCAYEGIMELLVKLKETGYRLAIVSNKNQAAVTELNEIYFKDFISVAIGQKEGIRKKPAPDTVLQALRELENQELREPGESQTLRALYVGDSEVDFLTAKNAGMDCVLVSWGFRTEEELAAYEPVAMIACPEQLLKILAD